MPVDIYGRELTLVSMDVGSGDDKQGCVNIHIHKQSKRMSLYETIAQNAIGIMIGWLLVYYILPYIGIQTNKSQATLTTMIFFVSSFTRSYVIRRVFEWMK